MSLFVPSATIALIERRHRWQRHERRHRWQRHARRWTGYSVVAWFATPIGGYPVFMLAAVLSFVAMAVSDYANDIGAFARAEVRR